MASTTEKKPAAAKKPVVKKVAVKKPAAAEPKAVIKPKVAKAAAKKSSTRTSSAKVSQSKSASVKISAAERYRMVETAAYFIAERNGFKGNSADNWIAAEAQIKKMLAK